jgi:hypothetical protein
MRKVLVTALAAVTILAHGMLGNRAGAMPLATPSALGVATADAALVQQATNVCGSNGCVRVQTQRVKHYRSHRP